MDFVEILDTLTSKDTIDIIIAGVRDDQKKFDELLEIAISEGNVISFRAAWAISHIGERHPQMVATNYNKILKAIFKSDHVGQRRCLLRSVVFQPLPEDEEILGELIDKCFEWMMDMKSQTSLKYYSLEFLYRATREIPELKNEFSATLEQVMPYQSTGFKNRANKILAEYADLTESQGGVFMKRN